VWVSSHWYLNDSEGSHLVVAKPISCKHCMLHAYSLRHSVVYLRLYLNTIYYFFLCRQIKVIIFLLPTFVILKWNIWDIEMEFCRDSLQTTPITVFYSFITRDTKNGESMHNALQCEERTAEYCCCKEWQFYVVSVTTPVSRREKLSWLKPSIRSFFFEGGHPVVYHQYILYCN